MITNKEVSRFRETIFANNNKDISRAFPMAGRNEEFAAYKTVFQGEGPHIVTMSGLLGSGKTFFLDAARGRLVDSLGFPEHRNAHRVNGTDGGESADDLARRFSDADPVHRVLLELEEMDRKGEFSVMLRALCSAVDWLRTTRDGLLVVTGDRFLDHPAVVGALTDTGVPITAIDLEPLSRDLLTQSLCLRLGLIAEHGEPLSPTEIEGAAQQILGDVRFERTLLPLTAPPTANFREAFGLLKNVAGEINRQHSGVAFLLSDVVKLAPRVNPARTPEQERVDAEMRRRVLEMLDGGSVMIPMETDELRSIAGTSDAGPELFWNLIQPLVTGQVLEPVGVPFWDSGAVDDEMKYVGPFLPRQKTILRVLRTLREAA